MQVVIKMEMTVASFSKFGEGGEDWRKTGVSYIGNKLNIGLTSS